jgi:Zn-dependent M28 family amino/carboxypeptidase
LPRALHRVTNAETRQESIMRRLLAPLLLSALAACASPQPVPIASFSAPQEMHAAVAAFAQPTPDGRLATLKAQLDAAGLAYEVESFDGERPPPAAGHNVVVRLGPEDGKEILITAHYDAVVLPGGKLADGAVDNAASVVAMIEAARRLDGRTKHPVRLILFDQEELGLVGAQAWIEAHGVDNVAAVINADVNGNGDTLMYGLNNGAQSSFMIDAVKAVCAERAISCLDFPDYPPSDDRAFSAAGAPVISLGHQPKAEAEKLRAFMLNPPTSASGPIEVPAVLALIHTPNDTIARVEASTLALAADTFTALVLKVDGQLD